MTNAHSLAGSPTGTAAPSATRARMPRAIWIAALIFGGWGVVTANPFLTVAAVMLPPILIVLFWRPGEPPVLLFACVMQWLQSAVLVFYANQFNFTLAQAFGGSQLDLASWLSLGAVLALALGMRVGLLRAGANRGSGLLAEADLLRVEKVFVAYIFSFIGSILSTILAARMSGLSQLFLGVTGIKWVIVFVLFYVGIAQRRGYGLITFCVLLEFAFGISGFFGEFKGVFFLLTVVIFTSAYAFEVRRQLMIAGIGVVLLISCSAWSAVKGEYREFLKEGYVTQEVLVPLGERFDKLGKLVAEFDWEQMVQGFDTLVLRTGYVELFARTIGNVPDQVPYEHGALWGNALKHVVTPRIFFPDKAALDDSERTSLYTGIEVAGVGEGTSIGIGYFGESYVDFGPVFMFVPIFLLGVFYGLIYRCFVLRARRKLLGSGIVGAIMIFGAYNIETSNVKVVGGNVAVLLVLTLFYRFAGASVMKALQEGQRKDERS